MAEAKIARGENPEDKPAAKTKSGGGLKQWLREHPMADPRFSFFIFVLIPVQTLFAHNYLTLPLYVKRVYEDSWIGTNFEIIVNLNPLLIFVLVPIVAFYLLYDWDNMVARIDALLPRDHAPVIRRLAR